MGKTSQKAIFFDRDGVLNIDTGYPHKVEDCTMIDGADHAIKLVNDHGFKVFIVTNQGGIGLGLFDEAALHQFHDALLAKLTAQGGVITDIAFCPHHPKAVDAAMQDCLCRKPKPGMITTLAQRHGIEPQGSIMIGDRETDVAAGHAAGCDAYLFGGGSLYDFMKPIMDRQHKDHNA